MTREPQMAIDQATRTAVASASNPFGSAWVSANAGSGKTFVLSRRVVRLLLAGTDPGRILCLTFTKAAAAEMAKRVFATLGDWTMLSDAALRNEIVEIGEPAPDADRLAAARRLFARALETPGGLKIQTIHAFCERLLHQFPFEANVAGHFEILEDRDAAALKEEARRRVLSQAAGKPDGPLGRALSSVLTYASDMAYEEALAEFVRDRDRLQAWIDESGGTDAALALLREALGLGEADTPETLRKAILTDSLFDTAAVGRLLELLRDSDKSTDAKAAARLAPRLSEHADEARIAAWLDFLTTSNGELRKSGSLVTKAVKDAWPGLAETLEAEIDRLGRVLDRIKAADCFLASVAMIALAGAAIGEYTRLKAGRGLLDFDDLILKTARLLSQSGASQWIQYKLDRGLDHILVDEAQDTSPRQWQVIQALAEDFFSGLGASDSRRTLFAVGDEKQSIFSFQGAVPAWFTRVQRNLGKKARDAAQSFDDVQLHLSFRSTRTVLSAVDAVFDPALARAGVTSDDAWPYHTAARQNDPGSVVVWPLIEPPERVEPDDWAAPLDHLDQKSPEVALAERIASTVDNWLVSGEVLEGSGIPIRPGHILVLTRTRGAQSDAIIRALKSRGVAIAGADRLRLSEHIAVMDLMALGHVMLLPEDDLSLAAVLKSPLVGLSEDDLFRLAHGRDGSLWDALTSSENDVLRDACARLEAWRAEADWRDPFDFFARILGPDHGREAFLRRLGAEAEDVIDEFLAQALLFQRSQTPSLQGFLAWLESAPTEIKRDTDMLRDEVRVMTVHGAKGLEAEIVFLVDTGSAPVHAGHDPRVLALAEDPEESTPAPLVWMRGRRAMPGSVATRLETLRMKAAEEYRRLLYVAMTRARDRLYVCGTKKRSTDAELGWHGLVNAALAPEGRRIEGPDGTLLALEWGSVARQGTGGVDPRTQADDERPIPVWARSPALPPGPTETRITPSTVLHQDEDTNFFATAPAIHGMPKSATAALQRGQLIHRLLQSLPDHPPDRRREVGAQYLSAIETTIDRGAMLEEVMAVLENPNFEPLFGLGSRAEVEITGRIDLAGGKAAVSGRIDRLAVTDTQVFIVDYKTNRPAPNSISEVPRDYIAQLSLYRRLLTRLYPERSVIAAFLWTDVPALMSVPEGLLDEALPPA